jgi:hypothetical protein
MAAMQSKNHSNSIHIEAIDPDFSEDLWQVTTYGPCAVYTKQLHTDTNRPNLFVVTGISAKSFLGTAHVIMSKLHVLEKKYHYVHIIKFCHKNDSMKRLQDTACAKRDEMKLDEKYINVEPKTAHDTPTQKWVSNRNLVFKPEIDFYILCAKLVNHIITSMKITNIEVIGKCAGGCIAINLITMNSNCTALYLASPGSPNFVEPLKKLDRDRLMSMKFYFGWPYNDMYQFMWGCAIDDKSTYDMMMEQLGATHYKSRIYGNFGHELHPDMICDICLY